MGALTHHRGGRARCLLRGRDIGFGPAGPRQPRGGRSFSAWEDPFPAGAFPKTRHKMGNAPSGRRHGRVEQLRETIVDPAGRPVAPYKSNDAIECLYARGRISKIYLTAAQKFRETFRLAALDTLKAPDLERVPGGAVYRDLMPGATAERARCRVAEIITALGGHTSPLGSCCWHVIGLEWSVRRWLREVLAVIPKKAAVIVVVAELDRLYARPRVGAYAPSSTSSAAR